MPQKVIEIVGASKESFAKAAENAVAEAAKTVRGMSGRASRNSRWCLTARKLPNIGKPLASTLRLNVNWNLNDQLRSAPHESQNIHSNRECGLLAHCAWPFVPTCIQVVVVAWSVASSVVGERSGARHLRVFGI